MPQAQRKSRIDRRRSNSEKIFVTFDNQSFGGVVYNKKSNTFSLTLHTRSESRERAELGKARRATPDGIQVRAQRWRYSPLYIWNLEDPTMIAISRPKQGLLRR